MITYLLHTLCDTTGICCPFVAVSNAHRKHPNCRHRAIRDKVPYGLPSLLMTEHQTI